MTTFSEANQARLALKMALSQYAWFSGIIVQSTNDGFVVVVQVNRIDDVVRKTVPIVRDGVDVRTEMAGRKKKGL
jgi:hypothetical protein